MEIKGSITDFENGLDHNSAVDAFYSLAVSYAAGSNGVVDYEQAHKWFNIAAAKGHEDAAEQRREISEYMTKSEIRSAQKEARAWLVVRQKQAA